LQEGPRNTVEISKTRLTASVMHSSDIDNSTSQH